MMALWHYHSATMTIPSVRKSCFKLPLYCWSAKSVSAAVVAEGYAKLEERLLDLVCVCVCVCVRAECETVSTAKSFSTVAHPKNQY